MTKKKWKKNMMALVVKTYATYGLKMDGVKIGKFYRDHKFKDFGDCIKSYDDSWEYMKEIRQRVGM